MHWLHPDNMMHCWHSPKVKTLFAICEIINNLCNNNANKPNRKSRENIDGRDYSISED